MNTAIEKKNEEPVKKHIVEFGAFELPEYWQASDEINNHPDFRMWGEVTGFKTAKGDEDYYTAQQPFIILRSKDKAWLRAMRRVFSGLESGIPILKHMKERHGLSITVTHVAPESAMHKYLTCNWESAQRTCERIDLSTVSPEAA